VQIVLSLANSPWPPVQNMSSTDSFPECDQSQDVLPTGAAANLHRIRGVLARGRAVISEVCHISCSTLFIYCICMYKMYYVEPLIQALEYC
jgi:hypothetical protein